MPDLSRYNPEGSRIMSLELNQSPYQFERSISRDPENIVTIFTVNTRKQYSPSGNVHFAGREQGERYRKVASITDPKYYVDNVAIEGNRDQRKVTSDSGMWVAMDWLNPENLYKLDQDFIVPNQVDLSTNLLMRGLFFIVRPYSKVNGNADDVPTEAEISAAETRLRNRYTELVRLYQSTSASNPAGVAALVASGEMIDALNYARVKTPYNTTLEARIDCPTCGDSKPAHAQFHKSESLGVICINPSVEGWKAAVAAGIKSRDDVPEEFRWSNPVGRPPRI